MRAPPVFSSVFARFVGIMMCISSLVVSPSPIVAWARVVVIRRTRPPVGVAEPEEKGEGGIGVVIGAPTVMVDLSRVFVAGALNNCSVAHI